MADVDNLLEELCGVTTSAMENTTEEDHVVVQEVLLTVERALLESNAAEVAEALATQASASSGVAEIVANAVTMAKLISEGLYADVIRTPRVAQLLEAVIRQVDAQESQDSSEIHLCTRIEKYLETILLQEDEPENRLANAYEMVFIGVAFFNMYVQANYTGPAFEPAQVQDIVALAARVLYGNKEYDGKQLHSDALVALQVDGDSPFSICEYPELLLIGRCFLHFVGNATHKNWSYAVQETNSDSDVAPSSSISSAFVGVFDKIHSAPWWNARAAVAHERLLLAKEPSNTLWYEARRGYLKTINSSTLFAFRGSEYLLARAHVEWGLAQHYFNKNKQGKRSFEQAKEISGLSVQLSGSLGKRTKFQQKSLAQMVLLAASKRPSENQTPSVFANAVAESTHVDFGGKKTEGELALNSDGLTEEEAAIQKLVQDGEASYRDINLDQVNPDNILLEKIAFEDSTLTEQGNLQIVDQIILLALCLDVKNSNANDGLTREEMFPYITRVLENPNNWMVYSTGLLERAWLECETSKRRERAVLQMQALVDQHTTRLTVTQNSLKAIEDSAPAHERMQFVHALAFPPRYALKRDLAERYFALGVFGSAVEICKELEMWDDVVKCYQILEKPNKAEKLVRERLAIAPTPYMWCCLGDLTGDLSHYETSWELSKRRFARAKRSLGRHAFETHDYPTAIRHYKDSVEVNPMNTSAWFVLGTMGMRTQDWDLGLSAFTRVVQLEPDNGEAWGNIGSIHLNNHRYSEAFSVLQEALKQKRHMWQMWENYLLCAMETERYGEAIYAMHQLLDLRSKHNRPVDHQILAWLVEAIVFPESLKKMLQEGEETNRDEDVMAAALSGLDDDDDDDDLMNLDEAASASDKTPPVSNSHYKKQLAMLFGRITSIITNNPKIWQVYAHFNDGLGRKEKALDCRLKQCRALQTAGWEMEQAKVEELCKAAVRLSQDYIEQGTKKALYSCRLYIRGVLKKAQVDYAHLESVQTLAGTLEEVTALEQQL